jgi:voltage-gated potassium channel
MTDRRAMLRRLTLSIVMLVAVVAIGAGGYRWFEGYDWFDALYATVTTITTVGGGEVHPFHAIGKLWTMLVVAVGFLVFTDAILTLVGFVIEGHLGHAFGERRMRRRIDRMRDHFILCGFGRIGREIAAEFAAEGIAFGVVDQDERRVAAGEAEGFTMLRGNAADIETLNAAGIERARGLVTAVDGDADNVYVTLTARVLRPDIFIVARANAIDAEPKLRLAGANRVGSPYVIGGRRMASLATRPTAVDFVDHILSAKNGQLLLEDFTVEDDSPWIGRTLAEMVLPTDEVLMLAMRRSEAMHFRPGLETQLQAGDELIFAGPVGAIHAMQARLATVSDSGKPVKERDRS